jgi:hypothetical protein
MAGESTGPRRAFVRFGAVITQVCRRLVTKFVKKDAALSIPRLFVRRVCRARVQPVDTVRKPALNQNNMEL